MNRLINKPENGWPVKMDKGKFRWTQTLQYAHNKQMDRHSERKIKTTC